MSSSWRRSASSLLLITSALYAFFGELADTMKWPARPENLIIILALIN
jgi:hypothetical protein